jgi:hypothetical protein
MDKAEEAARRMIVGDLVTARVRWELQPGELLEADRRIEDRRPRRLARRSGPMAKWRVWTCDGEECGRDDGPHVIAEHDGHVVDVCATIHEAWEVVRVKEELWSHE